MTPTTLESGTSPAAEASLGRIYAGVEQFDPNPANPAGSCGIISLDPTDGSWEWVLERLEPIRSCHPIAGGRRLAFLDQGSHPGLWVFDRQGNLALDLVARLRGSGEFAAPAGGNEFYISMSGVEARRARKAGLWKVSADGMKWSKLPIKAIRSGPAHSQDFRIVDCSADGQWLLLASGRQELHRVRPNGTDGSRLTWPDESLIRARFAPDGKRIVAALPTDDGESLWIMSSQGTERTRIIPEALVTIVACWSPTGSHLALKLCDRVRNERGVLSVPRDPVVRRSRIEIIAADGNDRRSLDLPVGAYFLGGWSPI